MTRGGAQLWFSFQRYRNFPQIEKFLVVWRVQECSNRTIPGPSAKIPPKSGETDPGSCGFLKQIFWENIFSDNSKR